MYPREAQEIIEALANGIHPETGEILPAQSSFNSPRVIRALFVATKVLERTVKCAERNDKLPCNAGRAWSEIEDTALISSFDAGVPVKKIAAKHGRTLGAIASRLVRLGKIHDRAEARLGAHPINASDLPRQDSSVR